MDHHLIREDGWYRCRVCGWTWRSRPGGRCPGLRRYDWAGAEAAGLATETRLGREGLKLAEGQRPVGVVLSGDNREYWRLYRRSEAVPKAAMTPAQRRAALANLEKARQALTCMGCGLRVAYKADLDAAGRCEACAEMHDVKQRKQRAGERLAAFAGSDDWVLVDFETTGLGGEAEIVQIGVVDAAGRVLLDQLVRPTVPVSPGARRVHGIGDGELAGAPRFADVYEALAAHLAGRQVLAYNVAFDARLLDQTCSRYGMAEIEAEWWCVMELFAAYRGERRGRSGFRWVSLDVACREMGVTVGGAGRHRGAGDALLTWRLVRAFRK